MRLPSAIANQSAEARRRIVSVAIIGVLLIAALTFAAMSWARGHAAAMADVTASQVAQIHAGLLASELQKFRLLPLVLIEYPDVSAVLEDVDPRVAARLNGKLELLVSRTDAAVIYVLRPDGRAIAASNWRQPDSFIGHNFRYRRYFQDALRGGSAELFALGSVSGRPGLYIARRVMQGARPLGIIVVKVEFDRLEAVWSRQAGPTFVADDDGVVLITSRPKWRFRAVRPLTPYKAAAVTRTLQYGRFPVDPIGLVFDGSAVRQPAVGGDIRYRAASIPMPLAGGVLTFLQPLAPAAASANASARLVIVGGVLLVAGVLGVMLRAREKAIMQMTTRLTLEREVSARTAELTEVNHRLIEQSRERERADRNLRAAREELAQANRLGSIGQITAGVAHEINQPVAAIRTFAENATALLDRNRPEIARANLGLIVDLTARIGDITAELRAFARRGVPTIGAIDVRAAIDGALLLIGDRIRSQGVILNRPGQQQDLKVLADRVGLEQVLINLIQNGLDAIEGQYQPQLCISLDRAAGDRVIVEVVDNGPGVSADLRDEIFTPFVTSRLNGLGLGLGIARDIAREFGGELELIHSIMEGAGFRLSLRRA